MQAGLPFPSSLSDLLLDLLSFRFGVHPNGDLGLGFHFLLISFSFRSSSEWLSPFPFLHVS